MKKSAADVKDKGQSTTDTRLLGPSESPVRQLRVGQTLLETTWRIAVPVVIFTALGIYIDLQLGTKPWLTLLGTAIGFILAAMLIARLLKESENE